MGQSVEAGRSSSHHRWGLLLRNGELPAEGGVLSEEVRPVGDQYQAPYDQYRLRSSRRYLQRHVHQQGASAWVGVVEPSGTRHDRCHGPQSGCQRLYGTDPARQDDGAYNLPHPFQEAVQSEHRRSRRPGYRMDLGAGLIHRCSGPAQGIGGRGSSEDGTGAFHISAQGES